MGAIAARAPLRVALGGGGTDLPSYYRHHGGFVVSTAIDRYVYMLLSADFQPRYRLKHLEWEEADDPAQVRHPILRTALMRHWRGGPIEARVGGRRPTRHGARLIGRLRGVRDQRTAAGRRRRAIGP